MVSLRQYTIVAVLFIPYDINTVKVSYKSQRVIDLKDVFLYKVKHLKTYIHINIKFDPCMFDVLQFSLCLLIL